MIAASDEATCTSPNPISGNGITISTSAYSATHGRLPRTWPSVPVLHASPRSNTAASSTRAHATKTGEIPPSTAILMNR